MNWMTRQIALSLLVVGFMPALLWAGQPKIVNVNGNIYESEEAIHQIEAKTLKLFRFYSEGGFSGNINVSTGKSDFRMKYVEHFKARSLDEAEKFAQYLQFTSELSGDTLTVTVTADRRAPWQGTDQSARTEIEIIIPEQTNLWIESRSFDITVTGPFANAEIHNEFGRIRVSDINDGLRLVTENSFVRISDIKGQTDVATTNAKLRAERIDTRGERGSFRNDYGVIDISTFTGILDCETRYGPVDLKDVRLMSGKSVISTSYSEIDAEIVAMDTVDLYMEDNFSNVSLVLPDDVEANFRVDIDRGGRILLSGIPVVPEDYSRERLRASTDNPTSNVNIELVGIGTVSIQGQRFKRTP